MARRLDTRELGDEAVWRGLLGSKVSLRYRLHGDPAHPVSEAVGVIQAVGDGVATVLTRRGEPVRVPVADVQAAKVLSP